MEVLEIQVEKNRLDFVMELLRQIDGVTINYKAKRKQAQQAFAEDTKSALAQVEAHQKGEIQLTSLETFLDEI